MVDAIDDCLNKQKAPLSENHQSLKVGDRKMIIENKKPDLDKIPVRFYF